MGEVVTAVAEKERRNGRASLADMMRKYVVDPQRESIQKARQRGILIGAGSDTLGSIPEELLVLQECGLTPYEALQTATINAAKILKNEDRFGTIECGKVQESYVKGCAKNGRISDRGNISCFHMGRVSWRGTWSCCGWLSGRDSSLRRGYTKVFEQT